MLVPVGAIRILTVVSSSRQVIARICRFAVLLLRSRVSDFAVCHLYFFSLFISSIMYCVLCNSVYSFTVLLDTVCCILYAVYCTCTFCNAVLVHGLFNEMRVYV